MERTRWTDDRIDDMVVRLDAGLADLREDIRALRRETRADSRSIREDISAFQRQVMQIGWGLVGAVLAVLVTLLVGAA
jgi:hypothetical protein